MPESRGNRKLVISLIVVVTLAGVLSAFCLVLLIRDNSNTKKAECLREQTSGFTENAFVFLSNALEALRVGDDAGIELWVNKMRNNTSIVERVKENC